MDIKVLEEMGLSNTEAKVYLALLGLGSATANKIAEKSGIHRRTVYDVIEILIEKGLVSFVIEANKKYYQAENPSRFLEILDEKKKDFQNALPELLEKISSSKRLQEVGVFRGKKGMINVFELMLKEKAVIYSFGSGGKFRQAVGDIYYEKWINKLKEKKSQLKIIASRALQERFNKNIEMKYIPEEYVLPSSTTIWKDNIAIQIYSEQPKLIQIKRKEVAESYIKYFELLWKIAKK